MLVFIEIARCAVRPYDAFAQALGADSVGWLSRNLTRDDLADKDALSRFALIGGRFAFSDVAHLGRRAVFCAIVNDPVERIALQYAAASVDPKHPYHAAANTFLMRELFEEEQPFAAATADLATRALMPSRNEKPSAQVALKTLARHRFIVGEGAHANAFANALARRAGLERNAISAEPLTAIRAERPKGQALAVVEDANREDKALYEALLKARPGARKVLRMGDMAGAPAGGEERRGKGGGPRRKT